MMNATPAKPQALRVFQSKELDLIRRTVAKDCNPTEFDLFMHICQHRGLDPLRRHAYAWVFSKDDPKKRNMVVVISQEGQLLIADRLGTYRPDERPPRYEYSDAAKDPKTNPLGIVRVEVTLFKHSHGSWHPVAGEAYWDEFAPIIEGAEEYDWIETGEVYEDSGRPKKRKVARGEVTRKIDPLKTGWVKSPRLMLAKCARMQASKLGWPDDFGGLYGEEEVDRAHSLDLTASEIADMAATERRLDAVKASNTVMFDWLKGDALEPTKLGEIADRVLGFVRVAKLEELETFADRNRHGLREFWARSPGDALAVKKAMEEAVSKLRQSKDRADALIRDLTNENVVYSGATLDAWRGALDGRLEPVVAVDRTRIEEAFNKRSEEIAAREQEAAE